MYQPLSDQLLRVMTGADTGQIPSLDAVFRFPAIQMELAEQYRKGKIRENALNILRDSALPSARGYVGFERDLPSIITGESQRWRLWRVDFYVNRLQLYYVDAITCNDPNYRSGSTSVKSVDHFRGCGYAFLASPASIGLDFTIPELNWQINCEMTSSSPTGSHTMKLAEHKDGDLAGAFTYTVPRIDEFQPPEIQV